MAASVGDVMHVVGRCKRWGGAQHQDFEHSCTALFAQSWLHVAHVVRLTSYRVSTMRRLFAAYVITSIAASRAIYCVVFAGWAR
eukprot:56984-Eustigmatos_ZCMA.PRE.1